MAVQTSGEIDIMPPLAWSEVQPTGFMVMPSRTPEPGPGRLAALRYVEELVPRPEGTLHRFTFPAIVPTTADINGQDRETFCAQVQEIVAAFPSHIFGGASRVIRFRGEVIDDVWRVGVAANGLTVGRQIAAINWVNTGGQSPAAAKSQR